MILEKYSLFENNSLFEKNKKNIKRQIKKIIIKSLFSIIYYNIK